jgi:hypothetical protein
LSRSAVTAGAAVELAVEADFAGFAAEGWPPPEVPFDG